MDSYEPIFMHGKATLCLLQAKEAIVTINKARELLQTHITMGSGYNRQAARLVMAEVMNEHGQVAVDQLVRELNLEDKFDFRPGMKFTTPGRK